MLKRIALNLLGCMAVACSVGFTGLAWGQNHISDPTFSNFDYDPAKHQETWKERWIPHQIKAPSEWKADAAKGTVELTGGETFLHSPYFVAKPGQKLAISVMAEGKGHVSVECLWWTDDGGMADPHRTIPIEPVELTGDSQRVSGVATVPEEAGQAYIRIVVRDGTVTVSKPEVTVAK